MKRLLPLALLVLAACSSPKEKYDPATYLNDAQKKDVLSGIVSYIFIAPPYTQMKDRFRPEHKHFYDSMSLRLFSLDRFYVDENSKREYYLVIRPGTTQEQKRAVGGYFDRAENNQFKNFSERFVTPMLLDSVARGRGRFLFDQMVKGDLDRFLKMQSYVQWPNPVSYYDSTKYEWVMDVSRADTTAGLPTDTVRIN